MTSGPGTHGSAERLQRSRLAILEHMARRERRHDPRETPPRAEFAGQDFAREAPAQPRSGGLFARARHAANVWWRHHPAHMAVEVAGPLVAGYGRRNPAKFLGFAALAGAALVFARPWKLISVTTLVVAVVKAGNLPGLLMSALSAADFERDHMNPG
jgi:Flp pilus assembly protein TadB